MTKIEAINIARTEALHEGYRWSDVVAAQRVWWPPFRSRRWRVVAGRPRRTGTVTTLIDDATGEVLERSVCFHAQPPLTFAQKLRFFSIVAALYFVLPGAGIWILARLVFSASPLSATLMAIVGVPAVLCICYAAIEVIAQVTYRKKRIKKGNGA